MGFWSWFIIWAVLVSGSLITFALIAFSLMRKLQDAVVETEPLAAKVDALNELVGKKPILERSEHSLLADPGVAVARKRALERAKIKKQQAKQRRLIASLKQFDPNESRFH